MSEVRVNNLSNENNTGGPTISGITTYSGRHFFVPPQGDTASRPQSCPPGSLRFNTDTAKLEYYKGDTIGWGEIDAELTSPLGGGTGSNQGLGTRGITTAGATPADSTSTNIDFITLSTLGNSQDFGNLTQGRRLQQHASSRTRDVIGGGYGPTTTDTVDFVTFASTGDAIDFGNLSVARYGLGALSNQIRGVWNGGDGTNVIDYVTIATTGNAKDFGDGDGGYIQRGLGNTTRGLWLGSEGPTAGANDDIHQITIMTLGNSTDFGDLSFGRGGWGGGSNAIRGIMMGGAPNSGSNKTNVCDYITIATLGNAIDFGDLSTDMTGYRSSGCASATRAVKIGGYMNPGSSNTICYVDIASLGNPIDFGDTVDTAGDTGANSNGHGGL